MRSDSLDLRQGSAIHLECFEEERREPNRLRIWLGPVVVPWGGVGVLRTPWRDKQVLSCLLTNQVSPPCCKKDWPGGEDSSVFLLTPATVLTLAQVEFWFVIQVPMVCDHSLQTISYLGTYIILGDPSVTPPA